MGLSILSSAVAVRLRLRAGKESAVESQDTRLSFVHTKRAEALPGARNLTF